MISTRDAAVGFGNSTFLSMRPGRISAYGVVVVVGGGVRCPSDDKKHAASYRVEDVDAIGSHDNLDVLSGLKLCSGARARGGLSFECKKAGYESSPRPAD